MRIYIHKVFSIKGVNGIGRVLPIQYSQYACKNVLKSLKFVVLQRNLEFNCGNLGFKLN